MSKISFEGSQDTSVWQMSANFSYAFLGDAWNLQILTCFTKSKYCQHEENQQTMTKMLAVDKGGQDTSACQTLSHSSHVFWKKNFQRPQIWPVSLLWGVFCEYLVKYDSDIPRVLKYVVPSFPCCAVVCYIIPLFQPDDTCNPSRLSQSIEITAGLLSPGWGHTMCRET